jgi:hypothetical protein
MGLNSQQPAVYGSFMTLYPTTKSYQASLHIKIIMVIEIIIFIGVKKLNSFT